jgi:hypothetical protein
MSLCSGDSKEACVAQRVKERSSQGDQRAVCKCGERIMEALEGHVKDFDFY